MLQWTPDKLFYVTFALSSLAAFGAIMASDKRLKPRKVLGETIKYGCLGVGTGAFCFEFLGGKKAPWLVIGTGMLVGGGAIKLKDIRDVVLRAFNFKPSDSDNDSSHGGSDLPSNKE